MELASLIQLALAVVLLPAASAFNIEIRKVVRKAVPTTFAGARFGTSLTFHSTAAAGLPITTSTDGIVIGAPLANRSNGAALPVGSPEPTVNSLRPGTIVQCTNLAAANDNSDCMERLVDDNSVAWWPVNVAGSGLELTTHTGALYSRRDSLFGYLVRSSGQGGRIMTCAPLTKAIRGFLERGSFLAQTAALLFYRPAGACITSSSDFTDNRLYRFCNIANYLTASTTTLQDNSCVGGYGAVYSPGTSRFVTTMQRGSAPNVAAGRVINRLGPQVASGVSTFVPTEGGQMSARIRGTAGTVEVGRNFVSIAPNAAPVNTEILFAASPLGRNFEITAVVDDPPPTGYVKVIVSSTTEYTGVLGFNAILYGEQQSASFGHAVVTGKFDEDALSDCIVSAPFYSDYVAVRNFENGRIYYYSGTTIQTAWQQPAIVDSSMTRAGAIQRAERFFTGANRARLGFAMANIGDTNRDGFDELAVGAPGVSTVYIYNGRPGGLQFTSPQVIRATEVEGGAYTLGGFGYALGQGSWDMDDNKYTDLLVSAVESEDVVFLKARPVVHMQAGFTFSRSFVDLNNCTRDADANINPFCFTMTVCFSINSTLSVGVRATANRVLATLSVCEGTINGQCTQRRRVVQSQVENVISATEQFPVPFDNDPAPLCFVYNLTLVSFITDFLAPLSFVARWQVIDQAPADVNSLTAIGTRFGTQQATARLNVDNQCGGQTCYPDMVMDTFNVAWMGTESQVVVGQDRFATLTAVVRNVGDPATTPVISFVLPENVNSTNLGNLCSSSSVRTAAGTSISTVRCQLVNPFPRNGMGSAAIVVSLDSLSNTVTSLDFAASVLPDQTSTPELMSRQVDNARNSTISLRRTAGFSLVGAVRPDSVTLTTGGVVGNPAAESDLGPQVIHSVSVFNLFNTVEGPSPLPNSRVEISYPERVSGQMTQYTLYLTAVNALINGTACNLMGLINPLGLESTTTVANAPRMDTSLRQSESCTDTSRFYCVRTFECSFPIIQRGSAATLELTFRLDNRTFQTADRRPTTLSTSLRLTSLSTLPAFTRLNEPPQTVTLAFLVDELRSTSTTANIGVIIGASVGGLVLIALIIIILYFCGFFKRKTHDDMMTQHQSDGEHTYEAAQEGGGGGGGGASSSGVVKYSANTAQATSDV